MGTRFLLLAVCLLLFAVRNSRSDDKEVMMDLKTSLQSPNQLRWTDENPCGWEPQVRCTGGRVTAIQIKNMQLSGQLPSSLKNLTALVTFHAQNNSLVGALPSFSGLRSLSSVMLNDNKFTSIPSDFFTGLSSLEEIYLDKNPFTALLLPDLLTEASGLKKFSASNANITGLLPNFFDKFSSLTYLDLSYNSLEGPLPSSFAGSSIASLKLNNQGNMKLNGSIAVLQDMTQLTTVWLQSNSFSGPLPNFTGLISLAELNLRDNALTGRVPDSLVGLPSLNSVILTNNRLQGKIPNFKSSVLNESLGNQSFCNPTPVDCDPRVTNLLNVVEAFGYPLTFANSWTGNNPCAGGWIGITCDSSGNITIVNFNGNKLSGTISPSFSQIQSLRNLDLSNNNLSGNIPDSLTDLPNLVILDVSNNNLYGKVPAFGQKVSVKTSGNVNIGKDIPSPPAPGSSPSGGVGGNSVKKSSVGIIVGSIISVILAGLVVVMFILYRRKKHKGISKGSSCYNKVMHPRPSGSEDPIKFTIAGSPKPSSQGHSGPSNLHIDAGSMMISVQVLRSVTNNFSESNILGRGGFGTVYEGELHDGTKIAVKRMESSVVTENGLEEFKSEISVLSKVRHRHLVALLGYCLEGNERLLVYEHMPQGTLSRFLFGWKSEGLKPLEWAKRLTIALDVARGVEYLHSLARQSFIHRDLKPSNILLGDDMKAKVADFGLVRLAPDGQASVATKLAGTFGYLAPEYAVTGKVTTKIDVYSFGVILMELITGRKALDDTLPDQMQHLVPWFRRKLIKKETFMDAIDPSIEPNEETFPSIITVAELAGHCTAREPSQRPDMGHAVNVLSSLTELWRPSEPTASDDPYGIDYNLSLPQVMQRWQALEGMSGIEGPSHARTGSDNTVPIAPPGFNSVFESSDGR